MFPTTRFTSVNHGVETSDVFQKDKIFSRKAASSEKFFSQIRQDMVRNQMPLGDSAYCSFRRNSASNTTRKSAWVGLNAMFDALFCLRTTNTTRRDSECQTPTHIEPGKDISNDPSSVNTGECKDHKRYREAHRVWAEVKSKLNRDQTILTDIYQRINEDKPWNISLDSNRTRQDMVSNIWLLISLLFCMLAWLLVDINEYIELTQHLSYMSYIELKKLNESGRNYIDIHTSYNRDRERSNNGNNSDDDQD
ncbi:unnamed protein product [Phytomonas sp. Hart1]|nr:unnamed protein product [Phytomonas sp. Hart1]|eukprot:CCW69759.1 unnamed protein product [Phytomonas sp. isolate Hart1]